jgi:hypothetical protein
LVREYSILVKASYPHNMDPLQIHVFNM